jgi:hypothetical protein
LDCPEHSGSSLAGAWASSRVRFLTQMCELSELSELSVLLLRFRRGEVCALSALCAISPPFELGRGMGRLLFQQ